MKKIILTVISVLVLSQGIQAQLDYLFVQEHVNVRSNGHLEMIFDQYGFKVCHNQKYYFIKSLESDSTLIDPKQIVFYEIYNKEFLLITRIDSSFMPIGTSIVPFYFPRREIEIIPIKTMNTIPEVYIVNFNSKIIIEDVIGLELKRNYFKISYIDIENRKVEIRNVKSGRKTKLDLALLYP